MATSTGASGGISGLDPSLTQLPTAAKKRNDELGKDDFLRLFITQLKNQDPLAESQQDPEKLISQLNSFTQTEQLLSIKEALAGSSGGNSIGSMASYLGHLALTDSKTIHVDAGTGDTLKFKTPGEMSEVELQLIDSSGAIVGRSSLGAQGSGEQVVQLSGLTVPNGDYAYVLKGTPAGGGPAVEIQGQVGGVVSGFVPGDNPRLIIAGREVEPASIKEVRLPPAAA